jgi:hypothetical protein
MKRAITIFSAAALTFVMASPVLAQQPTRPAVANADYGYFDSHPEVGRKLSQDPTLIDNQAWVDKHPELRTYLHDHPNVRHEMKDHPYHFAHKEHVYDKHHNY